MEKDVILVPPMSKNLGAEGLFFWIPAFGLLRQGSLTPQPWDATIGDERPEGLDLNVQPCLAGIGVVMANANRADEPRDDSRKRGVKVAMGGLHASSVPEEALEHWNGLSARESQPLWSRLLADRESGELKPTYRRHYG